MYVWTLDVGKKIRSKISSIYKSLLVDPQSRKTVSAVDNVPNLHQGIYSSLLLLSGPVESRLPNKLTLLLDEDAGLVRTVYDSPVLTLLQLPVIEVGNAMRAYSYSTASYL